MAAHSGGLVGAVPRHRDGQEEGQQKGERRGGEASCWRVHVSCRSLRWV